MFWLYQVKASSLLLTSFATSLGGPALAGPVSILVFLSLFGSFLGTGLISGRFCFAAGREGDLPQLLGLLHTSANTPVPAQITHAAITALFLSLTTRIGLLLRLFVFVSVGFDILVLCSLFRTRYR